MPSRLVNSQGRKVLASIPLRNFLTSSSSVPHCCRRASLQLSGAGFGNSGVLVGGRKGEREDPSLVVVVVAVGVVRGKKRIWV